MADTTLSLGVDSSGVRSATEDLGKFARAGEKAETSTAKIEAAFKKQQAAAEEFGRSVGKAVVAVGAIAVGSAIALDRLIKSVGDFQDLADQTGADPAGLASFKTAADIAGIGIESIATASVRLSSRLAKVGDDSKGAGRALAAIGIEVEKFKTLRPDEQYRAIAVALDGYADGAGKVAVATELFGQGGAKQLKALKEIAGQTEQNNGLTNEQIALADEYADASARLQSQLGLLAQKAAIEAAPALLALQTALIESISEVIGLDKATGNLATNSGVADFAEAAVRALGFVVDAGDGVARVFRVVGTTIGGVAAAAAALASGNLRQAQSISADLSKQVDSILSAEQFSVRLDRAIAAGKKNKPAAAVKPAVDTSKFVNTPRGRTAKAGRADNTEAAQLAADVDAIKSAYEKQANAFKNAESVLDALRASGLVSDREFYAAKRQFIERNADAQIAELDAENQRFASQAATGSERIRLDKQIADNKAKIAIIEADTSAKVTVLTIQQADALTKVARAYEQAEAAAQGYLDSLKQSQERELSGFGQGNKERERQAGLQQIQDKYQQQRQDLEQQRRAGQVSDEQYTQELDRINRFQTEALGSYASFYQQREELRKRADLGANEALQNYFDSTQDTYGQIQDVVTNAFQGAEDALVKFAQTGKLSFSDLANSILSDLARIAIRQSITGPLANAIFGGGGGGFASVLGSVFGAGKVSGGTVSAGGLYPINERGAEVLSIGSRDYLTMGSEGGKVTPISGGSQAVNVVNNFTVSGQVDRSTQAQIAARAGEGVQRAMARNT
jgi:lambda family phage tail tape measure protein